MIPLLPLAAKWAGLWWVKAIAVAVVVGLASWGIATVVGWKHDSAELAIVKPQLEAFQAAQGKANAKVIEQAPVDETDRRKLAETLVALEAEKSKVARAGARIKALEEITDVETGLPTVRLSDGFGLCFAANAAGDPADVAACEAAGGDGTVAPEPGR